jgi:hypothetical protein
LMRVVAIILLVAAAVVGTLTLVVAALALWNAITYGREYTIDFFWILLAWGGLFTLVPLVPGILLLRRSRKRVSN